MRIKKAFNKVHLWLGLTSGLVVFVSMMAAAIFVWEEELTEWYYHDYVFVTEAKSVTLPVSKLLKVARSAAQEKTIYGVRIKQDKGQSYVFTTYKKAEQPGFSWMSSMEYSDEIYVDQYSGTLLGVVDKRYDWIYMIRMLHQCLLINYEVGHLIVAIATLIIFAMVITGLVLWWPKNKAALKQRFSIKWPAKWRRINYDVHNVGGFYTYLLIMLFAATGLVWSFDWWTNGIYRILGNDPHEVFAKHEPPAWSSEPSSYPEDIALSDAMKRRPTWTILYFSFPKIESNNVGEFSAFLRFDEDDGWDESDSYYYHGQTGALHHVRTHEQKLLGEKWRNSNYAIHVGSIYGLPTKILACFIALFCASLPVTGFTIWWGRRFKKSNKEKTRHAKNVKAKSNKVINEQSREPVLQSVAEK